MANMICSALLVCAWVLIGLYADTLFRRAGCFTNWLFAAGTFLYGSTSICAVILYRSQQWGWISITYNVLQLAISLVMSVAIFGEAFTLRRGIAAALLLLALGIAE